MVFAPLCAAAALAHVSLMEEPASPLPTLDIDPKGISISGLSSGADFAAQFQVAFSRTIMGCGIFAGQPFHCAVQRFLGEPSVPPSADVPFCDGCPANRTVVYDHCKVTPDYVNVSVLAAAARRYSRQGHIDDVAHLRRARIYTFCGTRDTGHFGATEKARDFFLQFVNASQVATSFDVDAGHCWPQSKGIAPCGGPLPDQNCGYDGPAALLTHLYGTLAPPAASIVHSSLLTFDQTPFDGEERLGRLNDRGLVYVPEACVTQRCRLHVSMHGCGIPFALTRMLAASLSFNKIAERNKLVVLWPQKALELLKPHATWNERQGCWDAYGQTGRDYDLRDATQMRAVRRMIEAISGLNMTGLI